MFTLVSIPLRRTHTCVCSWVFTANVKLHWEHFCRRPSWINIACVCKCVLSVNLKSQKLQLLVKSNLYVSSEFAMVSVLKLLLAQVTIFKLVSIPLRQTCICACSQVLIGNVKSHWEHLRREPSWTDATWLFKLACCATSKWHWSHLNCDSSLSNLSNFQWM